ncbi:MAG TPA: ABC transporter permease subunit [Gemmataceae bacterium]|nr:ABC transporter permease subunit [Gemmataceae bacterium]
MQLGPVEITISTFLALLLAGGSLLVLVVLLRPLWTWSLGPVFFLETVRLARKGRTVGLRSLYAFILLLVILALHPTDPNLPREQLEQFANRVSHALLSAQCLVVLLLAPIYFGAAISEEKEKHSLDFLLLSPLPNHQIILGKLAGRWLHLFGVLLAGLPILALTQLWGGVDLIELVAGIVVMGLTLLSMGSCSLLISILARRTWAAVAASYVVASLPLWCCGFSSISYLFSPLGFLWRLQEMPEGPTWNGAVELLTGFAAVHGLITLASMGWSMFLLRPAIGRASAMPPVERPPVILETLPYRLDYDLPGFEPPAVLPAKPPRAMDEIFPVLPNPLPRRIVLPPVGSRPLLWKEVNQGSSAEGLLLSDLGYLYLAVLVVFLAMAALLSLAGGNEELNVRASLAGFTFGLVSLFAVFVIVQAGLSAAGSICRERDQRTLETLCSLPLSRLEILQMKWLGSLWRYKRCLIALAVLFSLAVLCRANLLPLLFLAGTIAVHAIFAVSLGIYLSVACRTTLRSYLAWILVMIAILAGTFLLGEFVNERTEYVLGLSSSRLKVLLNEGLNPLASWLALMGEGLRGKYEPNSLQLLAGILGMQLYLLASAVLCLAAHWRFRREGERG